MGLRKKKTDGSQNQAWLDWLNDDTPADSGHSEAAGSSASSFGGQSATKNVGLPKQPPAALDGFKPRASSARGGFPRSQQPTFTPPSPKPSVRPPKPTASAPPTLNWRMPSGVATPRTKSKASSDSDIAINIHLPQLKLPKLRKLALNWRYLRWVGLAILVVGLLVGSNVWLRHKNEAAKLAKQTGSAQPSYAPLKPTESDEGRVESTSVYNEKQKLYKYNDNYLGSALTVSQQPLPDDIKQNPDKLAKVAEQSIGATDSFDTANGKVYLATSEGGYQRLVLVHRQLLVFITSPKELEITDWVAYIQALE